MTMAVRSSSRSPWQLTATATSHGLAPTNPHHKPFRGGGGLLEGRGAEGGPGGIRPDSGRERSNGNTEVQERGFETYEGPAIRPPMSTKCGAVPADQDATKKGAPRDRRGQGSSGHIGQTNM